MKVPPDIIDRQRDKIKKLDLAKSPATEKLVGKAMEFTTEEALIEILKNTITSVTNALKSYANAVHKDRHHPLPFAACQIDECIYGRTTIDDAIGIVIDTSRIKEIDKELEDEDVKRLNVFATDEEKKELVELMKTAQTTPAIALSSAQALAGEDFASQAWKRVFERCHAMALSHGLSEIPGYYGCDTSTGEFVEDVKP